MTFIEDHVKDRPMNRMFISEMHKMIVKNLPPPPFAPAAAAVAGDDGSVYSVRAEAALPDGTVFVRETVVKVDQGTVRKFVFFSWKEGEACQNKLHLYSCFFLRFQGNGWPQVRATCP